MLAISSKLSGDLEIDLTKFEKAVQEKVAFAGVAAMAQVIYDEALVHVPVASGLLKDAIYRAHSKSRSTDTTKTYHVGWNKKKAPHGHLVEFGTSRAAAKPFMRPAFDRMDAAIEAGKERMAEKLDELKGDL